MTCVYCSNKDAIIQQQAQGIADLEKLATPSDVMKAENTDLKELLTVSGVDKLRQENKNQNYYLVEIHKALNTERGKDGQLLHDEILSEIADMQEQNATLTQQAAAVESILKQIGGMFLRSDKSDYEQAEYAFKSIQEALRTLGSVGEVQ